MDPILLSTALAAKLSTVTPAGMTITIVGAACFVLGWLWLVYQNARFGIVHGVLSVIPLYALIFAFVALEHRRKSGWTTMCLAGAVIAGLGYALVFAANDCENNDNCGKRLQQQVEEATTPDEGSVVTPPDLTSNPST